MPQNKLKPTLLLVHAWSSLPVDDADQLPRAADQVHLQLPVLIHNKLGGRIENACALGFILIVQVEFAGGEIVGLRAGVPVNFAETEKAVGDEANLTAVRSGNHTDVADVVADRAGDCDVADCAHLGERVKQALIFSFLKCVVEDLLIGQRRVFVNAEGDGDELAGLKVGSRGGGFDCFDFGPALGGNGGHCENKKAEEEETWEAGGEFLGLTGEIPELRHVVLLQFEIFPDPSTGQTRSIVGKGVDGQLLF